MIRVWRICKARWAGNAFSGRGAAEAPGRWNVENQRAVYCAESRALGCLEVLAHVMRKRTLSHAHFVAIPVDLPDGLITVARHLPKGWDARPHTEVSQLYGSRVLRRSAVVQVPSVIIPGEHCFVLNPDHADFGKIKIGEPIRLIFDSRVVGGHPPPPAAA